MIEARAVHKRFRVTKRTGLFRSHLEETTAVRGLDLQVSAGEIVGLLGVNGAGKTTSIKMLATLLEPSSGSITLDGIDAVREPQRVRPLINMIAGGERMLYWRLTARENLEYFGRLYRIPSDKLRRETDRLLAWVGLTEAANTPVEQYSKGMKQRLQIARGLINEPQYLFLDEPTLGLDAPVAREMRRTVKGMAAELKRGIVLTSHYMAEVEELCDRIYVLNRGELVFTGTSAQLRMSSQQRVVYQLEVADASAGLADRIKDLGVGKYQVTETDNVMSIQFQAMPDLPQETVFRAINLHGGQLLSFNFSAPTLEDVVVALAGGE